MKYIAIAAFVFGLSGCSAEGSPNRVRAKFKNVTHGMTREIVFRGIVNGNSYRLENDEVVCYASHGGLECAWKQKSLGALCK